MKSATVGSIPVSGSRSRDDRVLPETRVVAALVVGILILAVWVLYFHPDETGQFFAWTIKPRMTPLAMGAGYAMGAYFFVRVLTSSRWHRAAAGFLPITAFTVFMALATLLHWDRFNQSSWSFGLWAIIYAITPLLVPFIWLRNRRTDPGILESGDHTIMPLARWTVGIAGIVITLIGIVIFLVPDLAIRSWPWLLTPLTARVLAGWMMLPGIGGLVLSREERWSGWGIMVESVLVGAALFFAGVPRAISDWKFTDPLTGVVLGILILGFLVVGALYLGMALRKRRATA